MKRAFFSAIFVIFILSFSSARSSESATEIPSSVQKVFENPFLIGSTQLKFLGIKVYDIALWSSDSKFSYEKSFAIRIKYNMNFSKEDLAERSIVEIKRLHKLTKDEENSYLKQLLGIFHSVKKGDEKLAVFDPKKGVSMIYNGEKIGEISNPKLARLFVDIWLDLRGSYPEVTKKILGI
jgi:hypothetical protein